MVYRSIVVALNIWQFFLRFVNQQILDAMNGHLLQKAVNKMRIDVTNLILIESKYLII